MSIIDSIKERMISQKQTLQEKYVALLSRADSPQRHDEEALEEIIKELGIGVEQVEIDIKIIQKVMELQKIILTIPELRKQLAIATQEKDEYQKETWRITAERDGGFRRLLNTENTISYKIGEARKNEELLDAYRKKYPQLSCT